MGPTTSAILLSVVLTLGGSPLRTTADRARYTVDAYRGSALGGATDFKRHEPGLQGGSAPRRERGNRGRVGRGPYGPRRAPIDPGCRRVAWFMGYHENHQTADASKHTTDASYVRVAVLSARRYAPSLLPVLLVSGAPSALTVWFERQGGIVVRHRLSFLGDLPEPELPFTGVWLRLEVGNAMAGLSLPADVDPSVALYTDTDVMFYDDFTTCSVPKPKVVAIGPDTKRGKAKNTGVLYLNATAMAGLLPHFVDFAKERNFKGFPAHDQGFILAFFKGHIESLPDKFNWKGYWGAPKDERAVIVHLHGPKPGDNGGLECFLTDPRFRADKLCAPKQQAAYDLNPDDGAYYFSLLQDFYTYSTWMSRTSMSRGSSTP